VLFSRLPITPFARNENDYNYYVDERNRNSARRIYGRGY
jgi:hypothetical protein